VGWKLEIKTGVLIEPVVHSGLVFYTYYPAAALHLQLLDSYGVLHRG
jgi:hypothetical protein